MLDHLLQKWHTSFGPSSPEIIVRAPGRVNIIGEHTDYNEGWVLPGAMSRSLYILISKNENKTHHWVASDLNEEFQFQPTSVEKEIPLWGKYVSGTINLYARDTGPLNILIGGDLPVGAGVSSSSSLVCGLLFALHHMTGHHETKEEIALMGSRVEREIIGLQGGIMDQFAIMLSQENHVMMLDCRTQTYQFISADLAGCKWVLINTKVRHQLIDSDYNKRGEECQRAVAIIKHQYPEVKSLRDVTFGILKSIHLPEALSRRAKFVLEENARVQDMVTALGNKDTHKAGLLLKASHKGLRYDYEVSCDELNHLADFANQYDGVLGSRMMGGGFGGCVICLLEENIIENFSQQCVASYADRFGIEPDIIHFELGNGVERITIP